MNNTTHHYFDTFIGTVLKIYSVLYHYSYKLEERMKEKPESLHKGKKMFLIFFCFALCFGNFAAGLAIGVSFMIEKWSYVFCAGAFCLL